jgi:uncharacterized protein YutE (UPF0331/DUF86 family)
MVRLDVVRNKVRRLRDTGQALSRALPVDFTTLAGDRDALDLVSFRVYLAMQEAIDLAAHLIADQGWGPAPSLREHFSILRDRGVIDPSLGALLEAGVKVRNLIGHAYAEVDPLKLHRAATELGGLVDPYCAAVLAFAESAAT